MNTVIVPVDFSETSLHAARYAAQLLAGHYGVTMVLYHSYSRSSEAEKATTDLENLKAGLMKAHVVKMEILAHEENDFVDGLEKAARHRRADLVIMGITIVPENAEFKPLKNVMLTSDFKNTVETTPSVPIKDFLDIFQPQLHIVNVDKDHYISLTEDYEKEKQELKQMFADYRPEFYFMRLYDVDEAINLFAESRNIDLIIAVQKNHSFIGKLLSGNRTKTLSYHSKMPILVMHE
jgi:nucleotide-binding universal stress UspA family protein